MSFVTVLKVLLCSFAVINVYVGGR